MHALLLLGLLLAPIPLYAAASATLTLQDFRKQAAAHPGQTAAFVLEDGNAALLTRAWLADHAVKSIEVQYFIWSSDNIGTLAAEALLRAADRGVKVRVIVDDLLIDAPDKTLLALARHPNIDIRIYNPKHSVGTPIQKRVLNLLIDFRGFNQRMHDKVFVVDGDIAITGGRNMADEYFDFDQEYNFKDRDVLLMGDAPAQIRASFERFWNNRISVPAEELYDGLGIMQKHVSVNGETIQTIYADLHRYAAAPENFAPKIHQAIAELSQQFPTLMQEMVWSDVQAINDTPGKNDNTFSLGGGSRMATALSSLAAQAETSITIQSPYLILTEDAFKLFKELIGRGVKIRISTNSLASTDNLQAFSGYLNQRKRLLDLGIEVFEFKPDAANRKTIMREFHQRKEPPIFAMHAKSMVIDSSITYIGTFNLDPRSINLNTETGVIIRNAQLAKEVERDIKQDMLPENSWNAAIDDPNSHSSLFKRTKTLFWQLMPIESIL